MPLLLHLAAMRVELPPLSRRLGVWCSSAVLWRLDRHSAQGEEAEWAFLAGLEEDVARGQHMRFDGREAYLLYELLV